MKKPSGLTPLLMYSPRKFYWIQKRFQYQGTRSLFWLIFHSSRKLFAHRCNKSIIPSMNWRSATRVRLTSDLLFIYSAATHRLYNRDHTRNMKSVTRSRPIPLWFRTERHPLNESDKGLWLIVKNLVKLCRVEGLRSSSVSWQEIIFALSLSVTFEIIF